MPMRLSYNFIIICLTFNYVVSAPNGTFKHSPRAVTVGSGWKTLSWFKIITGRGRVARRLTWYAICVEKNWSREAFIPDWIVLLPSVWRTHKHLSKNPTFILLCLSCTCSSNLPLNVDTFSNILQFPASLDMLQHGRTH